MPSRHLVVTAVQADFQVPAPCAALSQGFRRWSIVNGAAGSVRQEFSLCALEPDSLA